MPDDDQLQKSSFFLQLIVMMKHVRTTPRVEPAPPASSAAPLPAGGWPAAACEAPSGQQRTLGSWAGWAEWAAEAVWLGPRAEQAVRYFVVAAVTTNVLVFPFVLAFHGPVPMSRKQAASQTIAQRPGQLALPPEAPSALDHASGCPKLTPQAPRPVSAKQPLLFRSCWTAAYSIQSGIGSVPYTGRSARAQRARLPSGMSFCCGVTSCEKQRSFDHMRPLPARPVGRGWPGGDSRGLPWALASAGPVCSDDSSSRSPFWAMLPTYSYNIHPTCT